MVESALVSASVVVGSGGEERSWVVSVGSMTSAIVVDVRVRGSVWLSPDVRGLMVRSGGYK